MDVFPIDVALADEPPEPENFTGRVRMHNVALQGGTDELEYLAVYFDAGAHTRPHSHSTYQFLYFVQGAGFVWLAGEERRTIDEGGIVAIPAGVVHMHGATDENPICHLAVRAPGPTDWSPTVPDEWRQYVR